MNSSVRFLLFNEFILNSAFQESVLSYSFVSVYFVSIRSIDICVHMMNIKSPVRTNIYKVYQSVYTVPMMSYTTHFTANSNINVVVWHMHIHYKALIPSIMYVSSSIGYMLVPKYEYCIFSMRIIVQCSFQQ